jgi:hypothetical protein
MGTWQHGYNTTVQWFDMATWVQYYNTLIWHGNMGTIIQYTDLTWQHGYNNTVRWFDMATWVLYRIFMPPSLHHLVRPWHARSIWFQSWCVQWYDKSSWCCRWRHRQTQSTYRQLICWFRDGNMGTWQHVYYTVQWLDIQHLHAALDRRLWCVQCNDKSSWCCRWRYRETQVDI